MHEKYDAVVVGGGPAGSIAAKTLAAAGVNTGLVDKDHKRIKPCGGATPSRSFEEFDLSPKEIVKKILTISTFSPNGDKTQVSLDSGYLALVDRGSFDSSLRKKAEKAGADLIEAEFLRIKEWKNTILITVAEDGIERNIAADYLIAADGVNSRIAGAAGLKALPGVYTIQEEIDIRHIGDLQGNEGCEFWFGAAHAPHFYSWVFPKRDYVDLGTGSTNGKSLKDLMEKFKARRRVFGNGRQKVYRLPLKWRDSLVTKNILFIGDAAGLVMPFSYEGIYYAMSSGKIAAEAVISGRPKDYEKKWRKKYLKQFQLMMGLKKYFLRNDTSMEYMVNLHKNKEVQDASIRLWYGKEFSPSVFLKYAAYFVKYLN